mmetsp:Transcript_54007/g.73790  ORF Transcript_54007/g.73790 Transcript_54007/m.73790 type:complete len:116 (-) Transcript_54007:788-1135(-)
MSPSNANPLLSEYPRAIPSTAATDAHQLIAKVGPWSAWVARSMNGVEACEDKANLNAPISAEYCKMGAKSVTPLVTVLPRRFDVRAFEIGPKKLKKGMPQTIDIIAAMPFVARVV